MSHFSLFLEELQTGLWPVVTGLATFFWTGLRKTPPSYLRHNPNLNAVEKLAARQLTATLGHRKIPLLLLAALSFGILPGTTSGITAAGAGAATGGILGYMYTRSPHLVLINAAIGVAGMTWLSLNPSWSFRYQAFKFATAWEDGEFIRAREWLNLYAMNVQQRSKDGSLPQWTLATLALADLACGKTASAINYASFVNPSSLLLRSDLLKLRNDLFEEMRYLKQQNQAAHATNLRYGGADTLIDPSRLESMRRYQQGIQEAPWRIMQEEKIAALFQAIFASRKALTLTEKQNLILQHYKGLFNFDPSYSDGLPINTSARLAPRQRAGNE